MKLELKEIQRRIEGEPHSKSKDEQWFLDFDEKGGGVFLKDVKVVVEDMVTDMRMLSLVSGSKKNCNKMKKKC